jgi:hypothetical protein
MAELHESDNEYVNGRAILLASLIAVSACSVLPYWFFDYAFDDHHIFEDLNRNPKGRLRQAVQEFPGPRLQNQPQQDLEQFKRKQMQELRTYGWVDRSQGLVRIPIEEAMDRYLQNHPQP